MTDYRWDQTQSAAGYDNAAEFVHPHYLELQQAILDLLPRETADGSLLVDAGGGSGRLVALFLASRPTAAAIVVDQSQPFLNLARERLTEFGSRGSILRSRLQDDWTVLLPQRPAAIVSMSAIHHLTPGEKQTLYRRVHEALLPGGLFINADEVRPDDDVRYLAELHAWSAHMQRQQDAGNIGPALATVLDAWRQKNIAGFGEPRVSGDDCHETVSAQLDYLRAAGFGAVTCPWHKEMWAILQGVKLRG